MLRVPARYSPYLFAIMQAGLTTGLATAIATYHAVLVERTFLAHWLISWGLAWAMIAPIVIAAAPFIQRIVRRMVG
jgi:hypothetical protein